MIKLLIVDDSNTEIAVLKYIFEQDKSIEIVGYAKDGLEALALVPILKPDIITMDIEMPRMNGFEATSRIMSEYPVPIVIISSKLNELELGRTFQALEAGALTVIDKPRHANSRNFPENCRYIIETIHSMAEIKSIKRRFRPIKIREEKVEKIMPTSLSYQLIAIGASIGGPQALKTIFSKLPANFSTPIVVVQHMTSGFMESFVKWLAAEITLPIKLAQDGEILENGTIYFAPDNYHLTLINKTGLFIVKLIKGSPTDGFCPSITELFKSIAVTQAKKTIGILLTGMGRDGAHGLLSLRQAGAHTFIQDEKSAVVFGMAGVAQSLHAVDKVVELEKISDYLISLTQR